MITVLLFAILLELNAFKSVQKRDMLSPSLSALKEATFGMGCFWSPQKQFGSIKGIVKTRVGYTSGTNPNPSYKSVCNNDGHVEALHLTYDDNELSYDDLLDVFWAQSWKTMSNQVGQYKSAIWYHDFFLSHMD